VDKGQHCMKGRRNRGNESGEAGQKDHVYKVVGFRKKHGTTDEEQKKEREKKSWPERTEPLLKTVVEKSALKCISGFT